MNPNPTFNGSFLFTGHGNRLGFRGFSDRRGQQLQSGGFADLLRRATSTRAASCRIAGAPRPNLTLNYGVRWDLMQYWSEKYNQIPTFNPGEQSNVFPTRSGGHRLSRRRGSSDARLVPSSNRFSPRLGMA